LFTGWGCILLDFFFTPFGYTIFPKIRSKIFMVVFFSPQGVEWKIAQALFWKASGMASLT